MSADGTRDDHNNAGYMTFLVVMGLTFLFFIYLSFIYKGVDIDKVRAKTAAEMPMAKGGGAAAAKVDVSKVDNPWVSSPAMIAHGKAVYAANCAFCHGNTGKGDGAAGATLVPKPRDLVTGQWTVDGSTIGLYKTISDGIPGGSMAAFKHLPVTDRWAMVHFIQSITDNKMESDAAKLEAFAKTEK